MQAQEPRQSGSQKPVAQQDAWSHPEPRSHLALGTKCTLLSWTPDLGCSQERGLPWGTFRNLPAPALPLLSLELSPPLGSSQPCRAASRPSREPCCHGPGKEPWSNVTLPLGHKGDLNISLNFSCLVCSRVGSGRKL